MVNVIDLDIHWDAAAIGNFNQLNTNFENMRDFRSLWDEIIPIIKNSIKENIQFGVDPDGVMWPPLSNAYAKRTGRRRMFITPISPIWTSYIASPLVRKHMDKLQYMPAAIMTDSQHKYPFYDLALRGGFYAGGWATGSYIPPREWFGINHSARRLMDKVLQRHVTKKMQQGVIK